MTPARHEQDKAWCRANGRFGRLLLALLASLLGPHCARCHRTASTAVRYTRPATRRPTGRPRGLICTVGPTAFLKAAILVRQGERALLCPACAPSHGAYSNPTTLAAQAAHAALRAMLGDHCAICGATSPLEIDQLTPPPYRARCPGRTNTHLRPSGAHHFLYYAALARAGRVQILCKTCNIRRPSQVPGWRETLDARARIT